MADNRGLAIGVGVARGLEKAATNIYNIGIAKEKNKREEEAFNLDKKVKNAQLKKLEFEQGPEATAHIKSMMKLDETAKKTEIEQDKLTILGEKANQERTMEYWKSKKREYDTYLEGFDEGRVGQIANMSSEEPLSRFEHMQQTMGEGVTYDFGDLGIRGTAEKKLTTADRKVLGEIEALKSKNASLDDINEHIKFSGYKPEDFEEKLKEYTPEAKKKFWLW